ncbi:hypothetical protein GLOIN_2v1790609 [Rhizophagus irregularis DAOM 181602=DAOM 197198]|nr:hypothetical protein GLOIN_2v1790609 [Rhizophagus irregularis DAOM 181602=DAOM 197198]
MISAKVGHLHLRLHLYSTKIKHEHLPTQTLTLLWNVEIPLDKDLCPDLKETIKDVFIRLGNQLINLIRQHTDKHSLIISDSVKYSPTFRWAFRNEPSYTPGGRSYITNDLVSICNHFNTIKTILKRLLPFVHDCSNTFKTEIWKKCNDKWKIMRSDMGLSKRSFKNYHKDFPRSNNN